MKIKDNIVNYLCDRDYLISLYDNFIYIFNFKYLESFNDTSITVSLKNRSIKILGQNLLIVKITKEELLIKGTINNIELIDKNE